MQLKLEHFNIKIGQHKVLLNVADARELGLIREIGSYPWAPKPFCHCGYNG